jgi:molybdopterin-guanine dinucleotide biosynthesis protein B
VSVLLPFMAEPLLDRPVVSFVAKSNTGKTTFLEALIPELRALGVRVGALKHHSHPRPFDMPGKDTYRITEAGADVVVGMSPVQIATFRTVTEPDFVDVIRSSFADVDIVLTEGYKRGPYPKIEVCRAARSSKLMCSEDELLAVVSDGSFALSVPQFDLDDAAGVAAFLVGWTEAG